MKQIALFCDGKALANPGAGGYGTILRYNAKERLLRGGEPNTTNNRMELTGVIEGLRALKEPCEVEVISGSSYVLKGINKWLDNWIKRDFKKVKNPDLWYEYIKVSEQHSILATDINDQVKHEEPTRCEQMAQAEAEKFTR